MSFFDGVKSIFIPSRRNAYRPHLLRRGPLLFLLALVLVAEAGLVANLMARQSGLNFLAAVVGSELVSLTNTERAQNNVGQLTENTKLDAAAQAKAADMAAKGYFAHIGPDGKQPWDWITGAGYDYQYAGENLAVRFVDSKDVVNAWMASPTHRANIVKAQYQEIGIGVADGIYKGQSATFVVQYFGKPSAASVATRAPVGKVLGAETEAPPASFSDTLTRNLMKLLSEPRSSTSWVLGGVALLLMLALAFAFFHHIQLQARDLLVPGTLVVAVALVLILFNSNFLSANISYDASTQGQGAAALSGATLGGGVDIGDSGASTED